MIELLMLSALALREPIISCTVIEESYVQDDGSFRPYSNPLYIGDEIIVDIRTGVMASKGGLNNTAIPEHVYVLDQGSDANAFKALTLYKKSNAAEVVLLQIYTFSKEIEKPFLITWGKSIVSGKCSMSKRGQE